MRFALALILSAWSFGSWADFLEGRVVAVADGDTITLVDGSDRLLCTIRTSGLRQPQCLEGVEPCHWHLATLGHELKLDLGVQLSRLRTFVASHRMTSSARNRIDSGMVMPRALAVLRLTTSSSFVGCSMGRSAGFAPLSILST